MMQPKCLFGTIRVRSLIKLLIPVVVTLSAGFGLWRASPTLTDSAQITKSNTEQGTLALNKPVSGNFTSGQLHSFVLSLQSNHYIRITVTAPGIGLRAGLFDEEGQALIQTACNQDSQAQLFWIAGRSGTHHLKIEICETEHASANYQAVLDEMRTATPSDTDRVAAQRLIVAAQTLRGQLNIAANRQAIQKYHDALQRWREGKDVSAEAETLRNIGQMLHHLGERQGALQYFSQSLDISRRANDRHAESRVLNDLGYLQTVFGNYQQALDSCSRALELSRRLKDRKTEAQALSNTAEIYHDLEKLRQALEYEQQSLRIWQDLKDRRGEAQALLRRGHTRVSLGEMETALNDYRQALQLFRAVQDFHGQALVLVAVGHLYSETGRKQEALGMYDQALVLSDQMESPFIRAELSAGVGYVYYELGEPRKALQYLERTLVLYQGLADRWGEAALYLLIGTIHRSMGTTQEALDSFRKAALLIPSLSNPRLESYMLEQMGTAYEQLGQKRTALTFYQRALSLNSSADNPRGEATVLNNIGQLLVAMGQKHDALEYFNQALPLTRSISDRFAESLTLANIARLKLAQRDLSAAREKIEMAISLSESLRSNVVSRELRTSYFSIVRQNYDVYVDILMQLDAEQPNQDHHLKAFEMSERARARSLLEGLNEARGNIREGVDALLLQRERSLEHSLNAKAGRHSQLLAARKNEEAEAVGREINQLTTEYAEVRSQIRGQSPQYAALTQPEPLDLKEIQGQVLDNDSLLLEYMLGEERSYLWAVTRTEVTSYQLPGRAEIEKVAREVYGNLIAHQPLPDETVAQQQARVAKATEELPSQSANLGRILLQPVAAKLGTKRLLIVADGALQYIPFQMLTVPDVANPDRSEWTNPQDFSRPLLADHEIVNEPSASALALLVREGKNRQPAPHSVAVLADPVFEADDPRLSSGTRSRAASLTTQSRETELHHAVRDVRLSGGGNHIPRLQASSEEADAIMAAAPWWSGFRAMGFEASRATAMRSDLGDYRIVHFATHGFLNDEHPELSGVVLSLFDEKGQPQEGFLRLHDIYNLKLPVDLVVLSACNTGLGKDVRGEGLIGLTRGFMYAGASSVVASLWKVDDEATAELMGLFYGYMLRDGLSPAAALREAQVEMSQKKRWQSPYYWAGFVIQGQYIQNEKTSRFSIPSLALWLFGLALVSAAVFYVLKRRRKLTL